MKGKIAVFTMCLFVVVFFSIQNLSAAPIVLFKGWGTGEVANIKGTPVEHTYACAGNTCYGSPGSNYGGKNLLSTGYGDQARFIKAYSNWHCRIDYSTYMAEGVCHQGANRLLYPTTNKATVSKARGYWMTYPLWGTYAAAQWQWKWAACKNIVGM
jgi:hypothetical protein